MNQDAAQNAVVVCLLIFGSVALLSRTRPPALPRLKVLGLQSGRLWLIDVAFGLFLGSIAAGAATGVILLLGAGRIEPALVRSFPPTVEWLRLIAVGLVGVMALAAYQQLIGFGFIRFGLAGRWNLAVAAGGSAIAFLALHILSPGSGLLTQLVLVVAGLKFVYALYISRRLWLPLAIHFGWLIVGGIILGTPVGGELGPALFRLVSFGPDWLTGGGFGLWGGAAGLLIELLSLGLLFVWSHLTDRVVPFDELSRNSIL